MLCSTCRLLPQAQRGSGGDKVSVMAVRAEVWRHEGHQEDAQQLARKASFKRGKMQDDDGEHAP
jgi:hypothetical protein